MRHTLVALMEDKPGVLNRISSLFRRRNFNIESLTVGHSETPGISRMTIVTEGDRAIIEQVMAIDGPALINFIVEQEENVYPMVAPGGSIGDMLRRPQPEEVQSSKSKAQKGGDAR